MTQAEKWTQRVESILLRLDDFTYATREQLQVAERLGGDRNAHRILYRLERDKDIVSLRTERKVYYLSNRGRERIGSTQGELKKAHIKHTLMRNDAFLKLGMPGSWRKEQPIKWNGDEIRPDATFFKNNVAHFVEIDNQQKMQTNEEKIRRYSEVFRVIFKQYGYHPVLLWYTVSDVRIRRLSDMCHKHKIKFDIIR